MSVQELLDIEHIKRLKYKYFRSIDMAQSDDVKSCFTEDATAYFKGGSYEIDLKNRDEIVAFMAEAFHPNAIAMHQGHHPEIDVLSETEAEGLWYLHDIFINLNDNTTLRGSALYKDTYKKVEWGLENRHHPLPAYL